MIVMGLICREVFLQNSRSKALPESNSSSPSSYLHHSQKKSRNISPETYTDGKMSVHPKAKYHQKSKRPVSTTLESVCPKRQKIVNRPPVLRTLY